MTGGFGGVWGASAAGVRAELADDDTGTAGGGCTVGWLIGCAKLGVGNGAVISAEVVRGGVAGVGVAGGAAATLVNVLVSSDCGALVLAVPSTFCFSAKAVGWRAGALPSFISNLPFTPLLSDGVYPKYSLSEAIKPMA